MKRRETLLRNETQSDLFGASTPAHAKERRKPARSLTTSPPARTLHAPGLLNVREAARRLGLSKSTLDKLRCSGKGPRFIKSTERAVRYDPADLDAWIEARRRQRTSRSG